jgi:hypothetical protein
MTPQAGEVWEFSGPILGHGYIFESRTGLRVRFRAGGEFALEQCWPAERLWTGNE